MSELDDVPPPDLAAALFVLGQAPIERVPWWAAAWIADGFDSEALRELAGLGDRDVRAIRDLFPVALGQLSVPLPSTAMASAVIVFDDLARRYLSGAAGPQWVAQRVGDVVCRSNDSPEVLALPLGRLYSVLDDAWRLDQIVPPAHLAPMVDAACTEQIRSTARRDRGRL